MAFATSSPTLRLFPNDDEAFASLAAALAEPGRHGPAALQHGLRLVYPGAVVRRWDPLAALVEQPWEVWYVYRDGSLLRAQEAA